MGAYHKNDDEEKKPDTKEHKESYNSILTTFKQAKLIYCDRSWNSDYFWAKGYLLGRSL